MVKRLARSLCAAVLFVAVLAPPAHAVAADFTGMVALNNCSGAVVRTAASEPDDPALVLTNGHCVKFMRPGEVLVEQPSGKGFTLVDRAGTGTLGVVYASHLAYATMTGTDLALFRLTKSYAQVERMGSGAVELSPQRPAAGVDVQVVSGYWKQVYSCGVDGFAHQLREAEWTWTDSIRFTRDCRTVSGTSGAPVVAGGKVVGVNNTGNRDGERCTLDNPCEVDANGAVTVRRGIGYAQQTYHAVPCLTGDGRVTLTAPGCGLARP